MRTVKLQKHRFPFTIISTAIVPNDTHIHVTLKVPLIQSVSNNHTCMYKKKLKPLKEIRTN